MDQTVKTIDTIQSTFRPSVAGNWCQSLREVTKSDCEWNIQFPFLKFPTNGMTSSRFSLGDYCFWTLSLTVSSDRSIYVYLNLECSPSYLNPIRVTTRILNNNCDLFYQETFFLDDTPLSKKNCVGHLKEEVFKKSKFYEKFGDLTIYCAVEMFNLNFKSGIHPKSISNSSNRHSSKMTSDIRCNQLFLAQFEEIFRNKTFIDVELNVAGRLFSAHKIILAARSKVFAAMFEHETAEKLSNKVDIKDVDPDVFQKVLHYMYTGQMSAETMKKMAVGILAVADKYMLDHLRDECEIHLKNGMSADNCVELLALSGQPHPAAHLKKYAVDFLRRYPDQVMATDGWKKAKEEKLVWSCDLIELLCDRKLSGV